jgi:hypothetical protein
MQPDQDSNDNGVSGDELNVLTDPAAVKFKIVNSPFGTVDGDRPTLTDQQAREWLGATVRPASPGRRTINPEVANA